MLPLFDMLASAQGGQGIDVLAQRFGLSREQAEAAVEALLPAFSQGLKRNASDPSGAGSLLAALSTGQHARYFDDVENAVDQRGKQEGDGILGHLFGSKDVSRAVASQAAQATGLGESLLKQMLPVLASMIMGGLFKQSTGQLQSGGLGGSGNPLGKIFEELMRQGSGGGAAPTGQQSQGDNPLGRILEGMFGGGAGQTPDAGGRPASPGGDNPLGRIFEEFTRGGQQSPNAPSGAPADAGAGGAAPDNPLGRIFEELTRNAGGQPGRQPTERGPAPSSSDNPLGRIFEEMLRSGQATQPEAAPQSRTAPGGQGGNPYDDLFGQMFETGRQQRDDYQQGVESIFDRMLRGMDRR